MQNDSVIVSVGTKDFFYKYDNSVIINAIFTRIFFLQYRSTLNHYKKSSDINISICFYYIKLGLYCAQNHRWPVRCI